MIQGGTATWNIRDTHMMDTLKRLMEFYYNNNKKDHPKSIVWAHNKLKVAPAIQPRALSIIQGRAVGVAHYLLGGIATTWAFFLARIIAVG